MLSRTGIAFLGALTAASFITMHAGAQNNPPATPPSEPPAQTLPQTQPAQPETAPTTGPRGDTYREQRRGRDRGGMERGQMRRGGREQMSDADRQAFFEARLASIKAGLMLNETQLRLWPPIENAVREMVKQRREWRERLAKEGTPANPVDRMKRMGELQTSRGTALTKYADALRPLYDTLSDEQKRRLRMLTQQGRQGMMQGGASRQGRGMYHHQHGGMNSRRDWGQDRGQDWGQGERGRNRAREGRGEGRGQYRQNWREPQGQPQQGGRGRGENQSQQQQGFGQGRRWQQDMPGEGFATQDRFEEGSKL